MAEVLQQIMNALTNLQSYSENFDFNKLSWVIVQLDELPMTVEMLDSSKVAHILQEIRKSAKLNDSYSEKIRFLIKCWRNLIMNNLNCIVPKDEKGYVHNAPNGYKNGIVCELSEGSNYEFPNEDQKPTVNGFHACIVSNGKSENIESLSSSTNRIDSIDLDTDKNSSHHDEADGQNFTCSRPKLKSTKDFLEEFSNIIASETKSKILNNKIEQEDDDALLLPERKSLREVVHKTMRYADIQQLEMQTHSTIERKVLKKSNCERLVKRMQEKYSQELMIIAEPMVPWSNLRRPLDMSSPQIAASRKRKQRICPTQYRTARLAYQQAILYPGAFPEPIDKLPQTKPVEKKKERKVRQVSVDYISDLLDSYEARETRKILAKQERQQKKADAEAAKLLAQNNPENQITIINNPEMSFKLKLKLPQPKVPPIKIRRKKIKRKKKKLKFVEPKVRQPRVPKPRPKPPITNFLDSIPVLPPLTQELLDSLEFPNNDAAEDPPREKMEFNEENVRRLVYDPVPGYNCTRHPETSSNVPFSSVYSVLVDTEYLHVFPWTDKAYTAQHFFTPDSDKLLQDDYQIPEFFS